MRRTPKKIRQQTVPIPSTPTEGSQDAQQEGADAYFAAAEALAELDADDSSILNTPLFAYAQNPDADKTISYANYLATLYEEIAENDRDHWPEGWAEAEVTGVAGGVTELEYGDITRQALIDSLPTTARLVLVSTTAEAAQALIDGGTVTRTYQASLTGYEPEGENVLLVGDTQTLTALGEGNYTILRDYGDLFWDVRMNINDNTNNFTENFVLPEAPSYGVAATRKAEGTREAYLYEIDLFGAAREVTGSCTQLEAAGHRLLIDCGMEQGRDVYENADLPYAPGTYEALLLTHAHIDHSGQIPYLYKNGYRGPIYSTDATMDLCGIMLRDSAHIQEQEAEWKNRKAQRSGAAMVEPDYTVEDAEQVMKQFVPCPYGGWQTLFEDEGGKIEVCFTDVGHLLGSSSFSVRVTEAGRAPEIIVFSGDIGNTHQPLIKDPVTPPHADYLVMESTYGDRSHGPRQTTWAS